MANLFNIIYETPPVERPEIIMHLNFNQNTANSTQNNVQQLKQINIPQLDNENLQIQVQEPEAFHEEVEQPQLNPAPIIPRNKDYYYCKTENCKGSWKFTTIQDAVLLFCQYCDKCNCIKCESIHYSRFCNPKTDDHNETEQVMLMDFSTLISKKEKNNCKLEKVFNVADYENVRIIPNLTAFECLICYTEIAVEAGVILRACLHKFCKECLNDTIKHSQSAVVECPFRDDKTSCKGIIQDREIKALVSNEIFQKHLNRSLQEACGNIKNSFQCKTPNCNGFWIYEDDAINAMCPICELLNCHNCRAIHSGQTCRTYQEQLFMDDDPIAKETKKTLKLLIAQGEAMHCPTCEVIIMRNEGCEWLICSMCKTEICWATRGPRWGPKGKGDTSGGCRCGGVKGPKCHPSCTYCH